ncbi:MAG TPA: ABC transporter ATP-binding protein [Caldilineaceae bacterium]|nr:ABC transporter ATP-binding protein [Caldilineaceae bacterium]
MSTQPSTLLEVREVSKVFRSGPIWDRETTVAVDRVSFALPEGRPTITGIVGESGSGKTTLALLLLGYVHPTAGQVIFRGKDVATMSRQERFAFRREVQPIFQDPFAAFNPFYRVDHVLTTPIARFGLADSPQEARRLIHEALEVVGLRPAETLGRFPHQLSGGQRQRIMVARAMLCRPRLIVADEPVSMVDASLRATILDGLQTLNRELGISIIYITHDLTTAYQVCDRVMVMYAGAVAEAGDAEQVIRGAKHPYTQLLVSSIPTMDRSQRWADEDGEDATLQPERRSAGCKFAPRCAFAQELCWRAAPPLYRLEGDQVAACVLYTDRPVAANGHRGGTVDR